MKKKINGKESRTPFHIQNDIEKYREKSIIKNQNLNLKMVSYKYLPDNED